MTLHELAQALSREVGDGLAAGGSAPLSQTRCFALVGMSHGHATAARFARWQHISRQSATAVIDDLVTRGYAERHFDPDNGRQLLLHLTS